MLTLMLAISYAARDASAFGTTTVPPSLFGTTTVTTGARGVDTRLGMAMRRRGRPKGPLRTKEVRPTMNREIQYDTLRVTTPGADAGKTGVNVKDVTLGVMSREEALAKAADMGGLDLILINENSDPPVCKIVDYSKFRYMKEKKAKELKKNAKASEVKEVKMSYKIDVHDYDVRKKNAQKFLLQGNRVKCTVMFKGREIQHDKLGVELLQRLAGDLEQICVMDVAPKRDGRNLSCFISAKPDVVKKINERKRALEKGKRKKKEESFNAIKEKKEQQAQAENEKEDDDDDDDMSLEDILGGIDDEDSESLDDLLEGDELTDDLFG